MEWLFKTVQDRLVNELRLAGIATIEAANRFLEEWLPIYNRRFAVPSAQVAILHCPKSAGGGLNRTLCIKTTRCLCRNWTVTHHGHLYQVRTHGIVEERVDGTMRMTHQHMQLKE